jgi:hypothetical protein
MKTVITIFLFILAVLLAEILAINYDIAQNDKKKLEHCLKHTNRTQLQCDSCEEVIYNLKPRRNRE